MSDEHSRKTTPKYTPRSRARKAAPLLGLLALACSAVLLGGCDAEPDRAEPEKRQPYKREIPALEELDQGLKALSKAESTGPLLQLQALIQDPPPDTDLAPYKRRFVEAGIDLWLTLEATRAVALAHAAEPEDPDASADQKQERSERAEKLGERLLELDELITMIAPPGQDTAPGRVAALLEPVARSLLRGTDDETRAFVEDALLLIRAARAQAENSTSAQVHVAESIRTSRGPLASQRAIWLGTSALRATTAPPESLETLASQLGDSAAGGFCPDGFDRLQDVRSAADALAVLRRRCALACTPPTELGGDKPRHLPPLDDEIYEECTGEKVGLDSGAAGVHLSIDSFLAIGALTKLADANSMLNDTLDGADARPIHDELAKRLARSLDSIVVPGGLPFLQRRGPAGLELLDIAIGEFLHPTQAVVVLSADGLSVAQWPRYGLSEASPKPTVLGEDRFVFPGVARRGSLPPDEWLRATLRAARQGPWPQIDRTADKDTGRPVPTLTMIVSKGASGVDVARTLRTLRGAGESAVSIVGWPEEGEQGSLLPRPVGITVRVDAPDRFTTRIELRPQQATFYDPRGTPKPIPILDLYRYLPDVYGVAAAYIQQNPALQDLLLVVSPQVELATWMAAIEALSWRRDGDVSASVRRLRETPPVESRMGPVSLYPNLYLGTP